jgi:hypothetical protein
MQFADELLTESRNKEFTRQMLSPRRRKIMNPRIMKSDLTNPPHWYIVTRYTEKSGINMVTGQESAYIVASKKYDVTDQMEAILAAESHRK